MRLALWQGPSPNGDVSAGLETVEQAMSAAAAMGARMAVFPEAFLPGYNAAEIEGLKLDGAEVARLRAIVRQRGVAVTIGIAEREGNRVFNSALTLGADGESLACYRKIQLWGPRESAIYEPGDSYVTFPFEDRVIGLLICYDIEFPEHSRALARQGADLILAPTANMRPYDNVSRYGVPARAMENAVSVAYCNYCGIENGLHYQGGSIIAGPEGHALALAGETPTLLITDVPEPGASMERPTAHLADLEIVSGSAA